MTKLAAHPMLPEQTADEQARHAFLVDFKNLLTREMAPLVEDVYARQALPAFRHAHGRDPRDRHEVAEAMLEQPLYQLWSSMNRVQQELYVDSTAACVERQLPSLIERYRRIASAAHHGSLALDPALEPPRYVAAVDIHCIPGGYFVELGDDDVYAGARYDIGSFLFGRGQRGPLNDLRGQTGVAWLREHHPELQPRRILDLGCAAGMNTLPYVDAYPQAEVHAIDVSAPCLRYAHARAEALGRAAHFRQANAEATPYESGSFDLVVSHILFHETSRAAVPRILAECHRLLRPGGVMLHLDVPRKLQAKTPYEQFIADWDTRNNNEPFWGAFMFDLDMRALAKAAGFRGEDLVETLCDTPGRVMKYWVLAGKRRDAEAAR